MARVFCLLVYSTAARRSLDSSTARAQARVTCIEYSAIRCGSAAVPAGAGTRQLNQHHGFTVIKFTARGRHATDRGKPLGAV